MHPFGASGICLYPSLHVHTQQSHKQVILSSSEQQEKGRLSWLPLYALTRNFNYLIIICGSLLSNYKAGKRGRNCILHSEDAPSALYMQSLITAWVTVKRVRVTGHRSPAAVFTHSVVEDHLRWPQTAFLGPLQAREYRGCYHLSDPQCPHTPWEAGSHYEGPVSDFMPCLNLCQNEWFCLLDWWATSIRLKDMHWCRLSLAVKLWFIWFLSRSKGVFMHGCITMIERWRKWTRIPWPYKSRLS